MADKHVLITGAVGFIGFHLSNILLQSGYHVVGVDALTEYYDVDLKKRRLDILKNHQNFRFKKMRIEDNEFLDPVAFPKKVDVIIHLAAQAGVRYSIDKPREYVDTNLIGTFNVLELAKKTKVEHLLMASTSSVYGANKDMPFDELQKCDTQMSFYAATKKANEAMAHSYAHIFDIPITMFRFFTVYGPWGRPDMALFKFADLMLKGEPIDVYNYGKMKRDFTYVEDLVEAIKLLIGCVPELPGRRDNAIVNDSISEVAPFRIVNIGNSQSVELMDYIKALEGALGITASKNMLPMQQGDVPATFANTNLLQSLTGFNPKTDVSEGIYRFAEWYKEYKLSQS